MTAPPGTGTVDVTVVTPFGVTPIVPADQYTYVAAPQPPLPPSNFIGEIEKDRFLCKCKCALESKWSPSPTEDVILYRIYKKRQLVAEVLAGSPLVFATCVKSKHAAKEYNIVAVNSDDQESTPVFIRIKNEHCGSGFTQD